MAKKTANGFIPCTLRQLPDRKAVAAARTAIGENPANAPGVFRALYAVAVVCDAPGEALEPGKIAMLTTKYWGAKGVDLGVSFLDTQDSSLKNKILTFMNHWGQHGNIKFREASGNTAQVRIARQRGGGYWSYLGTDILHIPRDQPTMNLEAFSLSTPDSEYSRVVEHETGHTLGFPHEHMRKEVVARLDEEKTLAYFESTQGWSEAEVRAQVLTPLEETQLTALPADVSSIMCYQLPASITTDGRPIPGGLKIDAEDAEFAAKIYPRPDVPPPPGAGPDFSIQFARNVRKGQLATFRAPSPIPAGTYDCYRAGGKRRGVAGAGPA